ncbi:MAG: M20/M25/M40 family metallo-hydrolase [Clostridia bacterium]|nr:M20/M25/M40 family metallo-hydrolase [Clostridia bacterium]
MTAKESVKNYPSERRMYANYVVKNIKKICKEVGPRPSGSEKELQAQEMMAEDLKTTCDEVKIEEFRLAPAAFMGWVELLAFCGVACTVLLFLSHWNWIPNQALIFTAVGTALLAIAFFFVFFEFLFYKEALDVFFPKKTSHNVVAVRKPAGEVKRRIIFSGHADSAPEWWFTYLGGPKLLTSVIDLGLGGCAIALVLSIITLGLSAAGGDISSNKALFIFSIVALCFTPVYIFCLFFYNPKRPVDGANDNLSGCLCSMAVPRFLQDHDIKLENTEVMVVLTGSEEAGLRGAKAFAKAHAAEFAAEKDVETVFIGSDTVRDFEYMAAYAKDMTGTVRNDMQVSKLLKEGAAIAGYDLPYKSVFFGSSDAAAITQGGMKATCFAAMDPAPARYYHTRLDTADNLDLKTIEAGVDILLETLFLFDEKGLDI